MSVADEDALVCDFAQYYHSPQWRSLPLPLAATLAQGLPTEARSRGGTSSDVRVQLLAIIADRLGHIAWMFSADGAKAKNHPASILDSLTIKAGNTEHDAGFGSGTDFDAAWAAIIGGNHDV